VLLVFAQGQISAAFSSADRRVPLTVSSMTNWGETLIFEN
jgi:hypothetical protein